MSITFSTDRPAQRLGYSVCCYAYGTESDWLGPIHPTVEAAGYDHQLAHRNAAECDANGASGNTFARFDTDADPSVNMSNTNALHILDTLGFPEREYVGSTDAEDFLGRILLALAVAPHDAGIPSHVVPGPGATVINGGREDGYTQRRLEQLRTLAEFARLHRANVTWG
jgi:hypothetical protein